jgi:hypothetical protein
MIRYLPSLVVLCIIGENPRAKGQDFPTSIVDWVEASAEPLFAGTDRPTWDRKIRERGFILFEDNRYRLWFTGYDGTREGAKHLGVALSTDGRAWERSPANPLTHDGWVEDVFILKRDGTYFCFAEGALDQAHSLTSPNGADWTERGPLDVRNHDGSPLPPGPLGTPTVWVEDDLWWLFYERGDQAIWAATSRDQRVWTNVQDDPVITRGPETYDKAAVALNQIIKKDGVYYGFYHANSEYPWKDWTTCVARSTDLIHWQKYPKNPIITQNRSSAIYVDAPDGPRLYTMHPEVRLHINPKRESAPK